MPISGAYYEPNTSEEVDEDGRGGWWERVARSVLTSSHSLEAPSCEESASVEQGCSLPL